MLVSYILFPPEYNLNQLSFYCQNNVLSTSKCMVEYQYQSLSLLQLCLLHFYFVAVDISASESNIYSVFVAIFFIFICNNSVIIILFLMNILFSDSFKIKQSLHIFV
eukprot:494499_1